MTQRKVNVKSKGQQQTKQCKSAVSKKKPRKKVTAEQKVNPKPKKTCASVKNRKAIQRFKGAEGRLKKSPQAKQKSTAIRKKKRRHQVFFKRLKKTMQSKKFRQDSRDFFLVFIGVLLIALTVSSFFVTITNVVGYSMSPTLRDAELIFVQKTENLKRKDIIVFEQGNSQEVRRVIGLPGERLEFIDDLLYVNGNIIDEPYIIEHINDAQRNGGNYTENFSMQALTGEAFVPEDSYFVLGDNREWARDSREYGFVPANQVIGVVRIRLLPLNNLLTFSLKKFQEIY